MNTAKTIRKLVLSIAMAATTLACGIGSPEPGCNSAGFSCTLDVQEDGTILDTASGLVWQRSDSLSPLNWNDGVEYCAALSLAGHDDWELPSAAALATIYTDTSSGKQAEPTGINDFVFTDVHERYWSATTEQNGVAADLLDARSGGDKNLGFEVASVKDAHHAKCVRHPATQFVTGLEKGVTNLTAGWDHTCALLENGNVSCWGANDVGQLGDGTKVSRSLPKTVAGLSSAPIRQLASGYLHTCAVFDDGTAQCWGHNQDGQLGDGTIQVDRPRPINVTLTGITALALGAYHSCALLQDESVKCWGLGQLGALGDGAAEDSTTPVSPVGLTTGVQAIAAGISHSCALLNDGSVKCWGLNRGGEIGDGTLEPRLTPVTVSGITNAKSIFARGGVRGTTPVGNTCAVVGSEVKCWGANGYGQLGMGSIGINGDGSADQYEPVSVTGLTGTFAKLAVGLEHMCSVTSTGVSCWGRNDNRQLGDGTPFSRSKPVFTDNDAASAAVDVAAGSAHACALTKLGGVACWGSNRLGQLGFP